jgi:antitoxin (DNA-binding transcriptional repressor) of toxin-antitoxin stability system
MKQVTAAEASSNFSSLIQDVAQGETVVLTADGKPLAKIEAVNENDAQFEAKQCAEAHKQLWQRLMSHQPVQNLGKISRDELYDDAF